MKLSDGAETEGESSTRTDGGRRKQTFRVLTYNVWIAPLVRWNPIENLEAICKFIESLDVDIVCLQEAFDWRLGPMGFLCETLWGGGASFGPLSWFFYVEGLLFPVSQTCHQKRIIEALLPSLPHHLPSAPIPFGRGHNQGLLVLSKHPLHQPLRQYLTCTPVHHMGFQAFTVAPLPREGRGKGGEAGAREDIRFVNLHLVPNFHTHPWKGRVLGWLGERDVPRMQAKQLAEIGEEVGREGGKEGGTGGRAWCVVGDFNVHRPRVLGVGSLVDQVTCPQEQHILDHFVSPLPYNYKVFADNTLSDHYPVLATFAL